MDSRKSLPVGHNGWAPILMEDVTFPAPDGATTAPVYSDRAAAALVVQDYNRARAYLETEAWGLQWEENEILYDAPLLANMADPTRAAVPRFTVNNTTNTMGDAAKSGLFSQKPPFMIRPRGDTTQALADAWTALIGTLLDRMNFQYWVGLGIEDQALQGTAIWKCGWSTRTRKVHVRKAKASPEDVNLPAGSKTVETEESLQFEVKTEVVTESYPWLEKRMLGTTLFDPGWRTPNRPDLCGFAVDVDFPTWMDLEEMRKEDCYEIPDAEALKAFFFHRQNSGAPGATSIEAGFSNEGSVVAGAAQSRSTPTSADPLSQPMLLLERWDENRVMTVLGIDGRYIVIRKEEHAEGRIPHFTANWRNKANAGYGIGMGKLVGSDQRIEQGTLNHALGLLAYQLNPGILHAAGQNTPTGDRTIRAGGFFAVTPIGNDVRNAMAVMEMPKIPGEAWQMIQYAKSSGEETSGADATFMQGNLGGKGSSAARTATGAGRIAAKADGRVQTPVEALELGLFNPYLNLLIDQVKTKMPTKEIKQILSKKYAAELMKSFDFDAFIEADIQVEMVAASKLAAKSAMAQQLPYLMQIFQQPQLLEQLHNEGKTVSLDVLLDVLFAVSEYRIEEQIIVDLTDDEKAHLMQMNAPNVKVQEGVAREQEKGKQQLALADRKAQNELATSVAEKALEREGSGIPLAHAGALLERKDDETTLSGQGPSPIAGG